MRIDQIKRDMDRKIVKAMKMIKSDGDRIIKRSFNEYYQAAYPKVYKRTKQSTSGALPGVITGGNLRYNLRIGYEPSQIPGYDTGMKPSGAEVFEWMVNGSMGVVGWGGFAQSALNQILELAPNYLAMALY